MVRVLIICSLALPTIAGRTNAETGQPALEEVYSGTSKSMRKRSESSASKKPPERPKVGVAANSVKGPVKIKEFLRDLSAEDRILFIDRLRLVDGRVASLYTAPLKKAFAADRVDQMLNALGGSSEAGSATSAKPRLAELSKLLAGLPAEVKVEFYDSMTFNDGELVSFRIAGLRSIVSKARLDEILLALGFDPAAESQLDSKGLCGGQGSDTWCNDSLCDFPETGPLRCISEKDYTCKSASCRTRP